PREERQAQLDGQPFQRAADPRPPPRACRPERDQLVASLGGLRKAREHPAEVVADPGPRPGERRHVDGDSHRSQASILPLVAVDTAPTEPRTPILPSFAWLTGYGELLRTLLRRELRARYRGSSVGSVWSLRFP